MKGGTEVTPIPSLRRVYKDTKANLDALTGLQDEDLAYGTDTLSLYRQNGAGAANWETIAQPTADASTLGGFSISDIVFPLTEAEFQVNAATGTFDLPARLNDTLLVDPTFGDAINEYAEVAWGEMRRIKEYRQFGDVRNNGDGTFKIQYWDGAAWQDWETGIATRTTADWSGWVEPAAGVKITNKVRLIATAIDTGETRNYLDELEVRG